MLLTAYGSTAEPLPNESWHKADSLVVDRNSSVRTVPNFK